MTGQCLEFFPFLQFPPGLSEGFQSWVSIAVLVPGLRFTKELGIGHVLAPLRRILPRILLLHGLKRGKLFLLHGLFARLWGSAHRRSTEAQDLEAFRLARHHVA
jgi:hypothetical protein